MSNERIGHLAVIEPCKHGRLRAHGPQVGGCPGPTYRPTNIDELTEILAREGWTVSQRVEVR